MDDHHAPKEQVNFSSFSSELSTLAFNQITILLHNLKNCYLYMYCELHKLMMPYLKAKHHTGSFNKPFMRVGCQHSLPS